MANLNIKYKDEKNSEIYTPNKLSNKLYNLINDNYNFKIILDPCIGAGGMTYYYNKDSNYYVIGNDINKIGEKHCDCFFNEDIRFLEFKNITKPDLVIMNPPFNGNGRGKNLLYPHLFLKTIFDIFGEDTPVVMITGDNFLNNNSKNSQRLKYISNGKFEITSIMTLPLNMFEGVKFNTQVLFFNLHKLKPHYIFDEEKIKIKEIKWNN